MKKITLQFNCLSDIANFTKRLICGFLINTCNNTVTANLSELEIEQAIILFNAQLIDTTEKVYGYQ